MGTHEEYTKFLLNIRNHFILLVMQHWHRLPREAEKSPSLEIFRSCLDMVLGTLVWVSLLGQGWDQLSSRGPCQLQPPCNSEILWFCEELVHLLKWEGNTFIFTNHWYNTDHTFSPSNFWGEKNCSFLVCKWMLSSQIIHDWSNFPFRRNPFLNQRLLVLKNTLIALTYCSKGLAILNI